MKFLFKLTILILAIIGGYYLYFYYSGFANPLSSAQTEIRSIYGQPEQFMVTYLPRGTKEDPQIVRSEVWFYPKQEKKVSFIGGEVLDISDFIPEEEILPTTLRPEEFDIFMTYEEVAQKIGELNIERFDIPGFFEEGVETFASDKAMFIIEEGEYLTYIQTIGVGELTEEDLEIEEELTEDNSLEIEESFDLSKELKASTSTATNLESNEE
ncbi:hypothetical protein ACFLZ9_01845 [Patescibacteria group bacterium]